MRQPHTLFRLFAVAAALWIGMVPIATAVQEVNDDTIALAVDNELTDDAATPSWNIDVSASDGIVTLVGTVDNILAKERAATLASTVKGVRGIVNRLAIEGALRSDDEIEEDVRDALLWDAVTETWEITPTVSDGTVVLSGSVDSWQEKQLAARVVKGVRGVQAVDNQIDVAYDTDRPNAEIKEEVERALRWDAYVDDALIEVNVDDGKVTLTGTVGSLAEKNEAGLEAWVAGVSDVKNALDVDLWARDERLRTDKYVDMTDEQVRRAVNDALLYDPRVASFEIDVEPDNGTVTLRGTVDNLKAKRAAARDARNVVGVWSVINRIKVRPGTPSDRKIARNVEDALARDPYVERYEIDVTVVDGNVYLSGDVDSAFEKAQADDVASSRVGVRDVSNFLTVNETPVAAYDPYADEWYPYDYDWYATTDLATMRSDWEIKNEIEDELFWSPFVDSDEVNVDVDNGTATLTGTVEAWGEREAATENAIEGGAVVVDNDLAVDYGPDYYAP